MAFKRMVLARFSYVVIHKIVLIKHPHLLEMQKISKPQEKEEVFISKQVGMIKALHPHWTLFPLGVSSKH